MLKTLAIALLSVVPISASAETTLWMAEENGCYWCAQWNEDIAHIFPKTAEGRTAPLQRYNLHGDTPEINLVRPVSFTPTFILVENGTEVGRIEGYPGEDFFWGLLTMMFERAEIPLDQES